jgi:hypothetical protein
MDENSFAYFEILGLGLSESRFPPTNATVNYQATAPLHRPLSGSHSLFSIYSFPTSRALKLTGEE